MKRGQATKRDQATRRAGFAGLMTAEAISLFGSRMTFVALPWLVLESTGSATRTGVVAFAEMLPYVVACAAGGPLIDRVGARRTAVAMDGASAVLVAGVGFVALSGEPRFDALVALVALVGLVRGTGDTAKRVIFPGAVAAAGVDLTRATAIHDGISRASILVGAPLAGVLLAATEAATVLFLDAASFAICATIILASIPPAVTGAAEPDEADGASYLTQLREGVRYATKDRLVLGIILMLFVTNLIDQANATVFVPVWAMQVYGSPLGIGIVSASFAAGAVAGNLAYLWLAPRMPRYAPFAVGFLIGGAPRILAMGLDSPLWTIVAVGVAAGAALSVVNPILGAVQYDRIPPRLQARVLGLSTALAWAGIPIGSVLGGWLADYAGIRAALLIAAGCYFAATLLPFTSRVWRQMDQLHDRHNRRDAGTEPIADSPDIVDVASVPVGPTSEPGGATAPR